MQDSTRMDADFVRSIRRSQANMVWAIDHEAELRKYEGKYVAIDDCSILGVSRSAETLRRRFADHDALHVTFVYPPDMVWIS